MKRVLAMIVALALLALSVCAWAEEDPAEMYEKAIAAWQAEDYETALTYLIPLAEMGEISSMYNVGLAYAKGLGVPLSYEEAAKYFKMAADAGHEDAQFLIGYLYREGEGVEQSDEQAAHYFQLAADQGNADAQYWMGRIYEDGRGVEKDDAQAARFFQLAADQGNADAQYRLGSCYLDGKGVEQSYEKAAQYYLPAADKGNVHAQYNLGCLYRDGKGVEQSYEQAAYYFQLAVDQDHASAMYNLGCLYANGTGVEQSYERAAEYFRMAADLGDAEAQEMLPVVEVLLGNRAAGDGDTDKKAADNGDTAKKDADIGDSAKKGSDIGDSAKKGDDNGDSAKKSDGDAAQDAGDDGADVNSRLLERAAATGMVLPELDVGESLYVGIADVPDTQQSTLYIAFALSPNGRAIRCLSLLGMALEVPMEGRDPWLIDRTVSTKEDFWIDLDQPQTDLLLSEDPVVSVLGLEIDGDTATCKMVLSGDYQDEANDVDGSYSVSETITLAKVGDGGAVPVLDPPTRAEVEAAGMTLPEATDGAALYLGAASVSQAEALYVAFTLSADGASLGNLTVFIKDMKIEYSTDEARVTINSSSVKTSGNRELPVESEIVSGNITLSDFAIDGDTASAVLRYTYHVEDDNVDFPFDPAQIAFAKVE